MSVFELSRESDDEAMDACVDVVSACISLCLSDYAGLSCAVSDDDDETVSVYAAYACCHQIGWLCAAVCLTRVEL